MAETTEANADPSMEEILASIRKIISDDVPPEAAAPAPEEVVELTQMVEEDGSVTDLAATPPAPEPAPAPAPTPPPVAAAPVTPPPAPVPAGESLIADTVANSMASKLSTLANAAEIDRLSAAPQTATLIGNGHRTLEDMVIELMRLMLKDWLDQNLPPLVEKLVQKEIERIARRS